MFNESTGRPSLLQILDGLPSDLHILPIDGNKRPLGENWQKTDTWMREAVRREVAAGRAKALGLLLGPPSGGVIAVDLDGPSAAAWVETHTGRPIDQALPASWTVTSGKTGRCQVFYRVDRELQGDLKPRKIPTGPGEQLELRWSGQQSVIAGAHPETAGYYSPPGLGLHEIGIQPAPDWVIKLAREGLPRPADPPPAPPMRREAPTDAVPLTACIAPRTRDALPGVGEGSRNDTGAWVARDLIGTAAYLETQGIHYTGDPEALLYEFGRSCTPPLPDREIDAIWRSAQRDNPAPSLDPDKIAGCIEAWQRRETRVLPLHRPAGGVQTQDDYPAAADDGPFLDRACAALFQGDWICHGGFLYQWQGNHYRYVSDETLKPLIKRWLADQSVPVTQGRGEQRTVTDSYPYARAKWVKEVLEWHKMGCTVPEINPPGINCINGVVTWRWEGRKPHIQLVPHDPGVHLFTSEPQATYNPDADTTEYERLMQCLDPGPRQILLKTLAASLDLETVRRFQGQCTRAVFLKGDGSNGKDTLRWVVQMLLGAGRFSSVSVSDFRAYDSERKFAVYSLRGKTINWPSENVDATRIDTLKGLRASITGDTVTFEKKYHDPVEECPKAIFLFNVNETPDLLAKLEASRRRWGIVPFEKTYSLNPGTGQLQADPRFKSDPDFIRRCILPALLNDLLHHLEAVVNRGIDYSCTDDYLDAIQREASHLLQFAQDTGLTVDPSGGQRIRPGELYARLFDWYRETGCVEVEPPTTLNGKPKHRWIDLPNRRDRLVKGTNQIAARIMEVFPNVRLQRCLLEDGKTQVPFLTGLFFRETGSGASGATGTILETRASTDLQLPEPVGQKSQTATGLPPETDHPPTPGYEPAESYRSQLGVLPEPVPGSVQTATGNRNPDTTEVSGNGPAAPEPPEPVEAKKTVFSGNRPADPTPGLLSEAELKALVDYLALVSDSADLDDLKQGLTEDQRRQLWAALPDETQHRLKIVRSMKTVPFIEVGRPVGNGFISPTLPIPGVPAGPSL